jgi:hypothetical protein
MKPRVASPNPEYLKFLLPFETRIRDLALATRALVLVEAPDSTELIYDAYNAVATGYSFTERPSDAFIHIAVYANWVNLGFNRGSELEDPQGVLQGSGRWIRHIRIAEPPDLEKPLVRAFVKAAVARAERPESQMGKRRTTPQSVVRAVYPKRRRPLIPPR